MEVEAPAMWLTYGLRTAFGGCVRTSQLVPCSSSFGAMSMNSREDSLSSMVGEWRTERGIYIVRDCGDGGLLFDEFPGGMHGVLKEDHGGWFVTEVRDRERAETLFGHLRLRREGDFMRSNFRYTSDKSWSSVGLVASRLPYASVFRFTRAVQDAKELGNTGECCTICLEEFREGDAVATLTCNHTYHRECFRRWFSKHGTCPLRCEASRCPQSHFGRNGETQHTSGPPEIDVTRHRIFQVVPRRVIHC